MSPKVSLLDETPLLSSTGVHETPTSIFRVNSLPLELLTQIFVMWARIDEDGPWTASATCHHWRDIALASGQVWSFITLIIAPTETPESADERRVRMLPESPPSKRRPLTLWIERARLSRLSVYIKVHPTFPRFWVTPYETLSLLKEYILRLRRLALVVESEALVETILEMLFRDTADFKLDCLEISISESYARRLISHFAPPLAVSLSHFWVYAPQADTLVFDKCLPRIRFPGSFCQSSELMLENAPLDTDRLMEHLREFPLLRVLNINGVSFAFGSRNMSPNGFSLHHLTDLTLHAISTKFCTQLFNRLDAPNLTSPTIGNYGAAELYDLCTTRENERWVQLMAPFGMALEAFVLAAPSLSFLSLHRCPIDDRHFLRILQAIPELQELHLEFSLIGTYALRGLAPVESQGVTTNAVLCPRLRRLHICNCDSIEKEYLMELLRSRCNNVASQGKLNISWNESLREFTTEVT
ncbi:hypothetical protein BDY19DRAFT_17755 [Irpex rosettiformis]|uniref:Uncharacterized protein n=1 Tax=Irpex rosettiformis TaxID=378272 RepID=A0ACB8UJ44_9APHY|nr:hypothetical protein BDY19DRAFT_17755 [Irpex rosettiformis]